MVVLINAAVGLDVVQKRRNREPQTEGEAVEQDESTGWKLVSQRKPMLVVVGDVEDQLLVVVRSDGNSAMV